MTAPLTERERQDGLAMIKRLLGDDQEHPRGYCPGSGHGCARQNLQTLLDELSWLEMVVEAEEGAGRVPSLWRGALRATQEELARMPAVEVRR